MNFVEQCRKGAGFPAMHRDVPVRGEDAKQWSMSKDDFAKFVAQVRSRSDDLSVELVSAKDRISQLSDEKASMANQIAELKCQGFAAETTRKVTRKAEALGLTRDQVKQLEDAVATPA